MRQKLLFLSCFLINFGCVRSNQEANVNPAIKDIIILKQHWEPNKLDVKLGVKPPTNDISFTLLNKSKEATYNKIDVNITFFDKNGSAVDSNSHRVYKSIQPGGTALVSNEYIGFVNPATKRMIIKVHDAEVDK